MAYLYRVMGSECGFKGHVIKATFFFYFGVKEIWLKAPYSFCIFLTWLDNTQLMS